MTMPRTRTVADLRSFYATLDADPGSEADLQDWLDGLASRTRARTPSRQRWAVGASAVIVGAVAVGTVVLAGSHPDRATPAITPTTVQGARLAPTPQVVAQTLLDLFPRPGAVTGLSGVAIEGHPQAELVYDDGHGAARVMVSLDLPPGDPKPSACHPGDSCQVLADGTVVSWSTNRDPAQPVVVTMWSANAVHPDGLGVTVTEFTAPVPKVSPATRAEPPFSIEELKGIVSSPRWQAAVAAEVVRRDATLFTPKPDTTGAKVPTSATP